VLVNYVLHTFQPRRWFFAAIRSTPDWIRYAQTSGINPGYSQEIGNVLVARVHRNIVSTSTIRTSKTSLLFTSPVPPCCIAAGCSPGRENDIGWLNAFLSFVSFLRFFTNPISSIFLGDSLTNIKFIKLSQNLIRSDARLQLSKSPRRFKKGQLSRRKNWNRPSRSSLSWLNIGYALTLFIEGNCR